MSPPGKPPPGKPLGGPPPGKPPGNPPPGKLGMGGGPGGPGNATAFAVERTATGKANPTHAINRRFFILGSKNGVRAGRAGKGRGARLRGERVHELQTRYGA